MSNPVLLNARDPSVVNKFVQAMQIWADHHYVTLTQALEVLIETLLEDASTEVECNLLAAMQDAFGCNYILASGESDDPEREFDADEVDDLDDEDEDDDDDLDDDLDDEEDDEDDDLGDVEWSEVDENDEDDEDEDDEEDL